MPAHAVYSIYAIRYTLNRTMLTLPKLKKHILSSEKTLYNDIKA